MLRRIGKIRKNKRGSLQDILLIGVFMLVISLSLLIGFKVVHELDEVVQGNSQFDSRGKDASSTIRGLYPGTMDNMFVFFSIGLFVVTIILAALVRIHPIFVPIFIVGLAIVVFFAAIFANVYTEVAANPELIDRANELTLTSLFMSKLPFIIAIFGIILMAVLYKTAPYVRE